MRSRYEKAIHMLLTEHKCPSVIALECGIDGDILHDMTDGCHFDEWMGSCNSCREDALEFMMNFIKE